MPSSQSGMLMRNETAVLRTPENAACPAVPQGTVVMLTCQYTEILGGAEKQCYALTMALRSKGVNVVVVTSKVPGFSVPTRECGVRRFWTYRPPQLAGRHLP